MKKHSLTIINILQYILTALALLCGLFICVIIVRDLSYNNSLKNYKYSREWTIDVTFQKSDLLFDDSISQDTGLTNLLSDCKEIIYSSGLKETYPELAWENLDTITIWYSDSTQCIDDFTIYGVYDSHNNRIVLMPKALSGDKSIYGCIIHETLHALFDNASPSQLNEGIVDYFTCIIAQENGLDYSPTYTEEITFWLLLCNIFGEKECLNMVLNDTLNQNIDALTIENAGKKFNAILYYISHPQEDLGFEKDELIMMAQEIVCNATREYVKKLDNPSEKEKIVDFCKYGLIIKDEYFFRLLS